jgi:glycosyltransferase involved in cell wall biosynthesis
MSVRNTVRFSILMPVFNQDKHVREAIDSVLQQTFTDFELIVIDDGSTDNSLELIRSYQPRVKLLQQYREGPEVARNRGAAIAKGEYLVFLDGDDFLFPFALATLHQVIKHLNSPPLVLATLLFFYDGQEVPAPSPYPIEVFKYKNYLSRTRPAGSATRAANLTDSIVVKRTVFEEIGGMRNSGPETFYNEDSHLLLKLGNYTPCVIINQPATIAYRRHATNSTGNIVAIARAWLRIAHAERCGEYQGKNRWGRYALIGGRSLQWALKYCWPGRQRKLAIELLFWTSPMIAVSLANKLIRTFRRKDGPIVLHQLNDKNSISSQSDFQDSQDLTVGEIKKS